MDAHERLHADYAGTGLTIGPHPMALRRSGLANDGEAFYFVHSFHCRPADPGLVLAECDYGGAFCAAVGRGRVFATQFHPEKSQAVGLRILKNFVEA